MSRDDDKPRYIRTLEPRLVGDQPPIKSLFSSFGEPEMTDEEWESHDAKVRAQLEAERNSPRALAESERQRKHMMCVGNDWPYRAYEAALTADESKPAVARVQQWVSKVENVLVLSGPAGCGKTVAAAWWAQRNESRAIFLRATTFAASSRYDSDKRDRWMNASALVLDDLGAEYADVKGNFLVDLDELVDTFYGDKRPLLVTTNASADEFKNRYGQRITDRIRECGTFASLAGASLRRKS